MDNEKKQIYKMINQVKTKINYINFCREINKFQSNKNIDLGKMSLRYEQNYIQNPHVFGSMNKNSLSPNFHDRNKSPPISLNNNFIMSQNSVPKTYQSLNLSNSVNQLPNDSKVSYARNFKQRLFQVDQLQQAKKQIEKFSYRQELQLQIKTDKQRKLREKQKVEREELEREKKFYAQVINIKAQQPKPKEQPSYLIMRSRKGDRKQQKTERNLQSVDQSRSLNIKLSKQPVPEIHMPKIMRRGGYHNQSTLDNITFPQLSNQALNQSSIQNPQTSRISPMPNRPTQVQQRQIQIIRQRNYEQERITSIIKMQQKMIRKLQYFKHQILKSNNHFNAEKQVQQIRNILRSKPIKIEAWGVKNDDIFNNNSDFYQFPKVDHRIMTRGRNRGNRSRINEGIDLNPHQQNQPQRTLTEQNQLNQQNQQQNEDSITSRKRKRQIKLFKSSNDKNYQEPINQNEQNPQMNIPILLRNAPHQKNQQDYNN